MHYRDWRYLMLRMKESFRLNSAWLRAGVICAVLACGLTGQPSSSSLSGVVRDPSGAFAAGARVAARHEATGFERATSTSSEGAYLIEHLLPGTYTITIEAVGFKTMTADGVMLAVAQRARLDFDLALGPAAERITVTAPVSPVETSDASVGYRLASPSINSLPLIGRHVISLVTVGPGAVPRHLGGFGHDIINDLQENRGAVAFNPAIHGARSTMNIHLLDGALNSDRNTFAIAVNPPLDAVQEFRILTSLAPAEYPQAGAAVVDVVTRSGERQFHGSAFEFFRNEATDARNFFDSPSAARPVFRQNQFGGSLAGPLSDRMVFFAAYEGVRSKAGRSSLHLVPTAALRGGDFRGRSIIYDPLSLDAAGRRLPFAGNTIPSARIDSIARTYLERFQPLPNLPGPERNYLDATPSEDTDDHLSARIDRDTSFGRLFGRYSLNAERGINAGFPVLPTALSLRAQQAAVGHTIDRGGWLNEARFSFTRLRVFSLPESAFRSNVVRDLGIAGIPDDPFNYGVPMFLVTNFNLRTDSPTLPQVQRDNAWHFSDSIALPRGRHSMKFGFQFTRFGFNYRQSRLARGQFIYTGALTAQPDSREAAGDAFADFLLGYPQTTARNVGETQAYLRENNLAAFIQDEWRPASRVTLNFGVRYDYFSPFREQRGNLLNLDYSTLPRAPRLVAASRATEPDRNNFAPRVSLAVRLPRAPLAGETVLRAGYGIYFQPEIAVESYDLVRNGVRSETNATDGRRPVLTTRDGFPSTASTGFPSYFGLDPRARTPYIQQWTFGLQREIAPSALLEVVYIGTKGARLGRFRTFNTALRVVTGENLGPRPGDLQSLRPFPELGRIIQRQHISNSSYHGLEIKAEKRMARSFALLASFVWSKSIDDADSPIPGFFESFGAQDERNLRLERGLSFHDVGRRISAAFVWRLPGRHVALRDWQLSGIAVLQDGTPLNPVYFVYDPANSGTPNRPDVVPGVDVRLPRSQRTPERFFNSSAFRDPAPFTFGAAGRNILPGPGNNVFDFALARRFPLREAWALQFRAEAFNAFNHPNWGIPGPYPDFGPFFGRIFSTGQPRRLQFALRLDW
jgi:outer membrane receptor protein involved in Fe transport